MISLDGTILSLVNSLILFVFSSIELFIYVKFRDKKLILSLIVCIGIFIFMVYLIYFVSIYGADVGWWDLPPLINSTEVRNVTNYIYDNI